MTTALDSSLTVALLRDSLNKSQFFAKHSNQSVTAYGKNFFGGAEHNFPE